MKNTLIARSVLGLAAIAALAIPVLAAGNADAAGFEVPVVANAEAAGYQAGDLPGTSTAPWHFRYAQADVTLPDVTSKTDQAAFAGYGVSVRLSNGSESAVLGVSTASSGGDYSPAFVLEGATDGHTVNGCADLNSIFIPSGDTIRLELYYDGTLHASVVDLTNSARNFNYTCADAGDSFTQAQIGTEFGFTPWDTAHSPAATSGVHGLATFKNTVITNRTGIRGSAGSAAWPVQKLAVSSKGVFVATPGITYGTSVASPDSKVRPGRNFGVYLGNNL